MILGIDSSKQTNDKFQVDGAAATYPQLLDMFEPRPIADDDQYWKTQAVIDALLSEAELSEDAELYLHLLSILLEAYDEQQGAVPELRGVALIQTLIEESGMKQRDLLPIFKHESVISDILAGRRSLTVAHIDQLAKFFRLPHQLFFEPQDSDQAFELSAVPAT